MDKDIDKLISQYTNDLMKLKDQWSQMGIATQDNAEKQVEAEVPELNVEPDPPEADEESYAEDYPDTAVKPDEEKENISPISDLPLADPQNFALFTARVYSGGQAYAVPDAKISIYLDGKLHAFLITDENGSTKQIKLESYPAVNNFIPDNTEQTLDYSADIFAEGFTEKRGLLVSAVGDSQILLDAELTPLSERID